MRCDAMRYTMRIRWDGFDGMGCGMGWRMGWDAMGWSWKVDATDEGRRLLRTRGTIALAIHKWE